MRKKGIYYKCYHRIEKYVPIKWCQTVIMRDWFFYPTLTLMIYSYNIVHHPEGAGGGDNIIISHYCEGRIDKSTTWDDRHHSTSLVMANRYRQMRLRFYHPILTHILDSFSWSPFNFYNKITSQKFLNKLRCNFTWLRHIGLILTSLDVHVHDFQ